MKKINIEPKADWTDAQWRKYWEKNPCPVSGCNKPVIVLNWHKVVHHNG